MTDQPHSEATEQAAANPTDSALQPNEQDVFNDYPRASAPDPPPDAD